MYEFHKDKARYFEMQRAIAAKFVLPMIAPHVQSKQWHVLEVGCAEAGVLKAFLDAGHTGMGIELEAYRADIAKGFLETEIANGQVEIVTQNIYDVDPRSLRAGGFDVIILKDVIEHIPHQEQMLPRLAEFLAPGGQIFFGFPPWMMPFGGHQQIAKSKWLSKLPWIHLLPRRVYSRLVSGFGESRHIQDELADIRSTRISIERFEKIVKASGLMISERKLWLFNPIYALKFGLSAKRQITIIENTPWIRNYLSTAAYYVVGKHGVPAKPDVITSNSKFDSSKSHNSKHDNAFS